MRITLLFGWPGWFPVAGYIWYLPLWGICNSQARICSYKCPAAATVMPSWASRLDDNAVIRIEMPTNALTWEKHGCGEFVLSYMIHGSCCKVNNLYIPSDKVHWFMDITKWWQMHCRRGKHAIPIFICIVVIKFHVCVCAFNVFYIKPFFNKI